MVYILWGEIMKEKCTCGEVVEHYNIWENKELGMKAYHYLCETCRHTFTALQTNNKQMIVVDGFVGAYDKKLG